MALLITNDNVEQEIKNHAGPIILEVFAPWCGPCQQMSPLFAELESELKGKYKFAKLNVDEARELSIEYGVSSVPTFIFMNNKKIVGKETGYMSKEDLRATISDLLG